MLSAVRARTPQGLPIAWLGLRALSERPSGPPAGASELCHKLRLFNGGSDFEAHWTVKWGSQRRPRQQSWELLPFCSDHETLTETLAQPFRLYGQCLSCLSSLNCISFLFTLFIKSSDTTFMTRPFREGQGFR